LRVVNGMEKHSKKWSLANLPPFSVIAHRGYSDAFPENTLAAFEGAIAAGAVMSELDVTLSRDRKVVVIHDDHLDRTTNASGLVVQHCLAELEKLDAGSWFDPKFAGERIPSLAEVITCAKGRHLLNIEIKSSAHAPGHHEDAIERQVAHLIRRRRMMRSTLVSSFSRPILEQLAAMKNPPALALISEARPSDETVDFCRRIRSFSWHPDHRIVTADLVEEMHRHHIRVYPWTIKTAADCQRVKAMGVDGVIVNDPHLVKGQHYENHHRAL
jgi:glycerophosphoryl diester phosphodiesterase